MARRLRVSGLQAGLCAGLAMAAAPAAAEDVAAVARAFGARPAVQQMSLSPDGRRIAFVAPAAGRASAAQVVDLAKGGTPRRILWSSGNPERLRSCAWASATRLICQLDIVSKGTGMKLAFTRAIAVDADGGRIEGLTPENNWRSLGIAQDGGRVIDWTGDGRGSVLMTRTFVPEMTLGTRLASSARGLGVERIDIASLARQLVETPRIDAVDYITDGRGTVRIIGLQPPNPGGYAGDHVDYFYRKPGRRGWSPLSKVRVDGVAAGFDPAAVDPDRNLAYGFDMVDGRRALIGIALDGSLERRTILSRPDVDVDALIAIGRRHRIVGAGYATERREVEFFDPELKALGGALGRAMPDTPIVTFTDASADEAKLLLFAGSDTNPGRYYLLDRATRHMEEMLPVRPEVEGRRLGHMVPVRFPAADGTMIPAYLTLPPGGAGKHLPAIVMPHGGPAARDEWGFDWLAQFFVARGFAVLQPNYRGSAGYGTAWFQKNGFQSWRTAIGDVDDAGRWLVREGIADPARLGIVGWSYGGYAALQSAVLDPGLYKAVVAIAPVTDLQTLAAESAGLMEHRNAVAFIGTGPHVREGSPARNVAAIVAPVLLFHGSEDRNVGIGESRLMADRLKAAGKPVELVEFAGLDHQLDDSAARAALLTKADGFLRAKLGIAD